MTDRLKRMGLMVAGASVGCFLALSAPAFAAAPQASAPPADVQDLVNKIQAAISAAQASFTPGESSADKEVAVQSAMASAIQNSGYDAVTEQAALQAFSPSVSSTTSTGQASYALLQVTAPLALQEVALATSTSGGASGGSGGGGGASFGGAAGGGGGGGGYVVSH